ncbi:MAG: tRNA (N(6)-L-threonylcarbamoyladenosine(37)-C(2))-methylthiotransferase MtaB [Candidatus Izemoplasmatales bacterium]|jgi:threonylcarbamoyladenosine tRNA methylthiotransferase MtaB
MKVRLVTLGCKVNTYESEAVAELLEARDYEIIEKGKADVYIVNSCMVTATAEQKSRQQIRRLFRENQEGVIVVMGCLSALKPEEIAAIDGVVITIGTKDRDKIPDLLDVYFKNKERFRPQRADLVSSQYDNLSLTSFRSHQRAFLKIEDGCDNFCTYCIIPYARGPVRSKPKELVIEEARRLAKSHPEIVLTGIHTGGYGKDLANYTFPDLLSDLEKIPDLNRIRLSSIEINEISDELIRVIKESKKIVRHLHIPLQSGSNRILKLMNRHYDREVYLKKIDELRAAIQGLALTSDVIAGFPGETEMDFNDTLDLIETVRFNELHVFPYSKRTGTVAANYQGEVPSEIIKIRARRLIEAGERLAKAKIREKEGQILKVIAERKLDGYLQGHSEEYIHIRFAGPETLIATEVQVRLIREEYPLSLGELV